MESIGRIELLAGSSDLLARDGNEASAASTVIRPGKKAPKRPVNDRHQLLIRYPRAIDTATFAHPVPSSEFPLLFFLASDFIVFHIVCFRPPPTCFPVSRLSCSVLSAAPHRLLPFLRLPNILVALFWFCCSFERT